jgi:hypothetical protein
MKGEIDDLRRKVDAKTTELESKTEEVGKLKAQQKAYESQVAVELESITSKLVRSRIGENQDSGSTLVE